MILYRFLARDTRLIGAFRCLLKGGLSDHFFPEKLEIAFYEPSYLNILANDKERFGRIQADWILRVGDVEMASELKEFEG